MRLLTTSQRTPIYIAMAADRTVFQRHSDTKVLPYPRQWLDKPLPCKAMHLHGASLTNS